MIVSEKGVGTIAVLDTTKITKTNGRGRVIYEGVTNSHENGRFVSTTLEIEEETDGNGDFAGFSGILVLTQDKGTVYQSLSCDHYRKHER